jgi:predicted ATPase
METDTARVRIEELRLAGFRAFENARLRLGDMTVLVGRNGAGKSTLLDAFQFIRDALSETLEYALERRGGILAMLHRGAATRRTLSVAVKLSLPGHFLTEAASRIYDFSTPQGHLGDAFFVYGFRVALSDSPKGYVVDKEVLKWIPMQDADSQRKEYTPEPLVATRKPSLSLPQWANYDPLADELMNIMRNGFQAYNFVPATIRTEPPVGPLKLLNHDGSNVGDVLRQVERHKADRDWVLRHLSAVAPAVIDLKSGTAAGRRIVHFFQQGRGTTRVRFGIGDMSDGTLRCLATFLALRQKPIPTIVCIDGIEESVHPAALGVLMDAAAASTERCQVLLTAHSPEALSHPTVNAQCIRVVEWRDGRSQVFRLSPGAEEASKPPSSVGELLRINALFTDEQPERVEGDFFALSADE